MSTSLFNKKRPGSLSRSEMLTSKKKKLELTFSRDGHDNENMSNVIQLPLKYVKWTNC